MLLAFGYLLANYIAMLQKYFYPSVWVDQRKDKTMLWLYHKQGVGYHCYYTKPEVEC